VPAFRISKHATICWAILLCGLLTAGCGADGGGASDSGEPLEDGKAEGARDLVDGNLIQFNENGAWSWYQDERAVIDTAGGKLILGSVASGHGLGGRERHADIDAVVFDLETGRPRKSLLMIGDTNFRGADDHNAPAFLVRPDGKYLAMYAGHNNNNQSYFRVYENGSWGPEASFDWDEIPGGTDFPTTYSNLLHLSAEGRVYNFARSDARSPNMMISDDQGNSWTYRGLLTRPDESIGYVNGYFKYACNGVDRIDFVATEHHPRDYDTSVYHGYLQDGQLFNSEGTRMDDDITDKAGPKLGDYSTVFTAGTVVRGSPMTRAWTVEFQTYDDGTIAAIISTRADDLEIDHRFLYSRFNGATWTTHYLSKAGAKLYDTEEDYTGLAAIHPDDPNLIFVSTTFDPRDDTDLGIHEIFKGVTADGGATWMWTPITQKSDRDNMRPIIPVWDGVNTALLWWRGTYRTAQKYDTAVVGILDRPGETIEPMGYVDATTANTKTSTGTSLVTTGPSSGNGPDDRQWHERTGFGNGGSVLTAAEIGGEEVPTITTHVVLSEAGTYDIWVNFWAIPDADWRIRAGLSEDGMQIFRQIASKQVEHGDHLTPLVRVGRGNTHLYQAYVGRVSPLAGTPVEVFIDNEPTAPGRTVTGPGDIYRTWYDGVSYARVTVVE